jgi:hypothetical protein
VVLVGWGARASTGGALYLASSTSTTIATSSFASTADSVFVGGTLASCNAYTAVSGASSCTLLTSAPTTVGHTVGRVQSQWG